MWVKNIVCVGVFFSFFKSGLTNVCDSGMKKQKESRRDCKIKHKVGSLSCNPAQHWRKGSAFLGAFHNPLRYELLLMQLVGIQAPTGCAPRNEEKPGKRCDVTCENQGIHCSHMHYNAQLGTCKILL